MNAILEAFLRLPYKVFIGRNNGEGAINIGKIGRVGSTRRQANSRTCWRLEISNREVEVP